MARNGGSGSIAMKSGGSSGLSAFHLSMARNLVRSLAGRVVGPHSAWRGLAAWSVDTASEPELFDSLQPIRLEDDPLFQYRDGTWGVCGRVGGRLVSMTLVEFCRSFCACG